MTHHTAAGALALALSLFIGACAAAPQGDGPEGDEEDRRDVEGSERHEDEVSCGDGEDKEQWPQLPPKRARVLLRRGSHGGKSRPTPHLSLGIVAGQRPARNLSEP